MAAPKTVRLNKHLAHTLGISRRAADEKIAQGKVAVNGTIVGLGTVIHPDRDQIKVNTKDVSAKSKRYHYVLLNKPVGYICSRRQQGETPTIYELLPPQYHSLKVAGRLDKDSCGLVLLTNDGDMIFRLTHPSFAKKKIYHVQLDTPLEPVDRAKIVRGVKLEDGVSKFGIKGVLQKIDQPPRYEVTLREGRNRQIRRTFRQLGYRVIHLKRQSLGPYSLDQLTDERYLQIT